MPPKRKRAGEETTAATETSTSTRTTRSSARTKTGKDSSESTENGTVLMDTDEIAPPSKKSRAGTNGTRTSAKRGKDASKAGDDDESGPRKPSLTEVNIPTQSTSKASSSNKRQSKTQSLNVAEPYSPACATMLFDSYAGSEDTNIIGAGGLERLCNDAKLSLDGALPLLLAWQLGCQEMARITRDEWSLGTANLKISSLAVLSFAIHELEDILLLSKPPPPKKLPEPYNRVDFWHHCGNTKEAFKKFYFFCFQLAKPEGSRNIDIDTASAMWSVLLAPKYPLMADVIAFIGEKQGTYKAANKDLWTMMLEFCETVNPDLADYESDGAWPTLLDDFVSWKKESGGDSMQTD